MAISFGNATSGIASGASSITTSHTMEAGNNGIIFHFIQCTNAQELTAHTYNGVASTALTDFVISSFSADRHCYIRYSLAPTSGAHNSVTTFSANTNGSCQNLSYLGVQQTGIPDALGSTGSGNVNNNTVSDGNPASVADQCWKLFWFLTDGAGNHAASSGTERVDNTSGARTSLVDSNSAITPAGTFTLGVTYTGTSNYVYKAFTFAPAIFITTTTDIITVSEPALSTVVSKMLTQTDTVTVTDAFAESKIRNRPKNSVATLSNPAKHVVSVSNTAKSATGAVTNTQKS